MTIEDLSARLEKVERQNRRMRAGGVLALVVLAAGVAMGQGTQRPRTVEAEEFILRGTDGKKLGRLGPVAFSGLGGASIELPALVLFKDDGEPSATLRGGGWPEVRLTSKGEREEKKWGWESSLGAIGGLEVSMAFPGQVQRRTQVSDTAISILEATAEDVARRRKEVERAIATGEVTSGAGEVMRQGIERDAFRTRVEIGCAPCVRLFDERGESRVTLGASRLVTTRTGATEDTGPCSLVFLDKDGKVIERLPK